MREELNVLLFLVLPPLSLPYAQDRGLGEKPPLGFMLGESVAQELTVSQIYDGQQS